MYKKRLIWIMVISVIITVILTLGFLKLINSDQWKTKYGTPEESLAHKDVLSLWQRLHIGQSRASVKEMASNSAFKRLSVYEGVRRDELIVVTPPHLGAKNWLIYIGFKNDEVVAIRIRRKDSHHHFPSTAPDDQLKPGFSDYPEFEVTNVY